MDKQNKIEIYQSKDKKTIVEVKFEQETIWLSQKQMAELFDKDVRTVNEHIKTIYTTGELIENSTIRKFRIVRKEGKRDVSREIEHYNLDMIISVGYIDDRTKIADLFRVCRICTTKENAVIYPGTRERKCTYMKRYSGYFNDSDYTPFLNLIENVTSHIRNNPNIQLSTSFLAETMLAEGFASFYLYDKHRTPEGKCSIDVSLDLFTWYGLDILFSQKIKRLESYTETNFSNIELQSIFAAYLPAGYTLESMLKGYEATVGEHGIGIAVRPTVKNISHAAYGTAAVLAHYFVKLNQYINTNKDKYGNCSEDEFYYWLFCYWAAPGCTEEYIEVNDGYDITNPGVDLDCKNWKLSRHTGLLRVAMWRFIKSLKYFDN